MTDTIRPVKKQNVKVPKLDKNGEEGSIYQQRWWLVDEEEDIGPAAWRSCLDILLLQQARQKDYYNWAIMYGVKGLGYSNTSIITGPAMLSKSSVDSRLKLNAAKCCVEAATSKIGKNMPRPVFVTTGGDWTQKKRAEGLTNYLDGAFDEANTYHEALDVFKDACIFGTGVMYVYADPSDGKVKTERAWIEEIVVDEAEGQYGNPRQMHRTKLVHREVLMAQYAVNDDGEPNEELAQMIRGATSSVYSATFTKDMIQVTESWHLPSSPDAGDGKRVISIKEGTLLCKPYTKSYFPFIFFRWQDGLRSFFGQGIIEQLWNTQLEINMLCWQIQQSVYFAAVPRVFLFNDSKINSQHIQNGIGSIVKVNGSKPPEIATATGQNPEVYKYLDYLWMKSFEQVGLSELTATSNKPAGLNAAVAMREYQDIETERFASVGKAWEQFFIDIAEVYVDLSRDLFTGTDEFEGNKRLAVKAKASKFMESIKWADVNLPEDEYILRCYPTSILPTQPAAKMQTVQEWVQAGWLDQEEAMNLLDFPDLERVVSLKTAAVDNCLMMLEKIIDEGEYSTPEPYQNLNMCIELGQGMYLKARNDGVGEEKLELLRRFVDDCNALLQQQGQPAPAQGVAQQPAGATTAQPQALPEKPTRSPMVPLATVPQAQ